jgi:hypothetical protein
MNDQLLDRGIVAEALDTAESTLRAGEDLRPFIVIERLTGREVESYGTLAPAVERFAKLIETGPGNETYALAYCDESHEDGPAIVIERGLPGKSDADTFVQRFRPRRGPLRRFKAIGDLAPA